MAALANREANRAAEMEAQANRADAERDAARAEVERLRAVVSAAREVMWRSENLSLRYAVENLDALTETP